MTPQHFIAKWQAAQLSERSACQQHFLDLCDLLGQPKPAEADPDGAWYTFEKGVRTTTDANGFADVWMRGKFGWEYKGKRKDLKAAYQQLLKYREDLENPPVLVVCDLDRFEIHTNFTGTAKKVFAFDLDGLAEPANLDVLRKVFTNPEALKPGQTAAAITEQAAEHFGQLADGLRQRGVLAQDAAHFLMKLIFCLFAEDIELLPSGLFTRILASGKKDPAKLKPALKSLFAAMSTGGMFGADDILYFNGGLFADDHVLDLAPKDIELLVGVSAFDWSSIEPSIFGTLFERTLDPGKRSQIGAHYTSREDIETLLKPVMLAPLVAEWDTVREKCDALWDSIVAGSRKSKSSAVSRDAKSSERSASSAKKARTQFDRALLDFDERLAHVTVLDPACGSGNFLYVALHMLLGLEKEVISYAAKRGLSFLPHVLPTQLAGLEINPYAAELAQVAIWIGYLQWMRDNGFSPPSNPVLEPIASIKCQDAIIDLSDPEHPLEPEWPAAEFIVGNPPFLGSKMMRLQLGEEYVDAIAILYGDHLPAESDLCCYWFERARSAIAKGRTKRAGLLATQGIRGGANREVLKRIKKSGDIFFAESDRDWVLNGANVHISMVGFDGGIQSERIIDGEPATEINPNLSATADITQARPLKENAGIVLRPPEKGGKFEVDEPLALRLLRAPNPNGRPSSDILRFWMNAEAMVKTRESLFIIDFSPEISESEAAAYQECFEYLAVHVKPFRAGNRYGNLREKWWIHRRPGSDLRSYQSTHDRVICTSMVSKHRLFIFLPSIVQPDKTTYCFARSDDFFFGVLHSRIHEVWALKLGTRLETRPRYTPTTCFETFPFPNPTDEQRTAIAAAARELDTLRNNWLNPPEMVRTQVLEFPGTVGGPWDRYIDRATVRPTTPGDSPGAQIEVGTVKYPRLVAKDDECAKELKKRTLTNLYNQRPTWLAHAHQKLDAAVFAAYGWDAAISDDDLLAKLLELNLASA